MSRTRPSAGRRRLAGAGAAVALAACGGPAPPPKPPPSAVAPPDALPATLVADCFLGEDRCELLLDLDGDGRDDHVTAVRAATCDRDDGGGCARGLWLALATGATAQVGAGVALPEPPAPSVGDLDPLAFDADLDGLSLLGIARAEGGGVVRWNERQRATAPCDGDGLVLSGSDAAALVCWGDGVARAYHLGF